MSADLQLLYNDFCVILVITFVQMALSCTDHMHLKNKVYLPKCRETIGNPYVVLSNQAGPMSTAPMGLLKCSPMSSAVRTTCNVPFSKLLASPELTHYNKGHTAQPSEFGALIRKRNL